MINYKRRNTPWLAALAVITALVMISEITPVVQLAMLALFLVAVAGSFVNLNQVFNTEKSQLMTPLSRSRMSNDAREAANRASSQYAYRSPDIQMIDVGLIATQTGRDGMAMRRTRSISKDDDGVRPFITLTVGKSQADREVIVRYEMVDQNGRDQYIHEVKVWLREGEMNILADHHLPLMKNGQIAGMGDWDLKVYLDGDLVGVHNFALTASYEERRRRVSGNQYFITGDGEHDFKDQPEEADEIPMSLEDLLRNQNKQ